MKCLKCASKSEQSSATSPAALARVQIPWLNLASSFLLPSPLVPLLRRFLLLVAVAFFMPFLISSGFLFLCSFGIPPHSHHIHIRPEVYHIVFLVMFWLTLFFSYCLMRVRFVCLLYTLWKGFTGTRGKKKYHCSQVDFIVEQCKKHFLPFTPFFMCCILHSVHNIFFRTSLTLLKCI